MFKIAFPWALHAEEKAEREYLKEKDSTSQDEVAGNVWITPESGMPQTDHFRVSKTNPYTQHWNWPKSTASTTGSELF